MKIIPLTQGRNVVVDDADFEALSVFRWYFMPSTTGPGYAVRREGHEKNRKTIYMHREIMNPEGLLRVDHRDGDGLRCVRDNMRICNHQQNMMNRKRHGPGYIGVYARGSRFLARLKFNGVTVLDKYFSTSEEAARARDAAAVKYHGEFASLNFPI